jgi:methylenetetrahydrofolate--tRNA-(uracil-5-)-methyltransferase
MVTHELAQCPRITVTEREVTDIPDGRVIIATGPLTSDGLASKLATLLPERKMLSFFDSAAPIVTFESIDLGNAYFASRYGKGESDYINCPLSREEYESFHHEIIGAEKAKVHGFEETLVFEGCLPIEVMAGRGFDTMRYGPMKPVGLPDPKTGKEPFAVVQLRRDNAEGTLYNLVGFQTHLKFTEQKRVFSMIPALREAQFARYGTMHRNTYLDSPKLLDRYYRLRANPRIGFAGQITGVEGYVESASSGLLAGIETAREVMGVHPADFPKETAIGALALYVSSGAIADFQPMNINFGLIEPLAAKVKGKRNRNLAISQKALSIIDEVFADENHR